VISNAPNTTASRTWTQLPENLRKAVTSAGMEWAEQMARTCSMADSNLVTVVQPIGGSDTMSPQQMATETQLEASLG
jgi:hypothetical protein